MNWLVVGGFSIWILCVAAEGMLVGPKEATRTVVLGISGACVGYTLGRLSKRKRSK